MDKWKELIETLKEKDWIGVTLLEFQVKHLEESMREWKELLEKNPSSPKMEELLKNAFSDSDWLSGYTECMRSAGMINYDEWKTLKKELREAVK